MSLNNKNAEHGARQLTRRGFFMLGAQAGIIGLLGFRLHYLQVNQAEKYSLLAEENRINIRLIPPARGLIFDRNNFPIAENAQNYRVVIVRERAGDPKAVLKRLSAIIPLGPESQADVLKDLKRKADFVPITVAENLTWEQLAAVSANAPAFPGVSVEVGLLRNYPFGQDFAHVVGYVGAVSDYDLSRIKDPDPLLQIPKFQIGKSGVENKIERRLRGFAGTKRIEVNAVGRVMREIDRNEGQSGANVHLTVDAHLQNYVQARLGDQSASAVLMDVNNGDLLAIGSAPSFDPNKFVSGFSFSEYKELNENPFRPFSNKATQGTYPPGSTFKMMVALAALKDGLITANEKITCRGHHDLGKQRFHCWKRGGHGPIDLRNSLKQSCDVYYYELAQRVGIEKISAMARQFALGQKHDLPLNGIASGLMPTKSWKRENRNAGWLIGDTLNASIGQGFVLASPLQLATMTARLATGRAIVPKLLRAVDGVETTTPKAAHLDIPTSILETIQDGMFAVSNERGGTGYSSRVAEKSMRMAGKSGTSQVRRITRAERKAGVTRNADLPWERRDHALFVAYAPYDAPKYAAAAIVEHGGGGSRFAAPIVRDILLEALYGGQPPASAYPSSQRTRIKNERKKLNLRNDSA